MITVLLQNQLFIKKITQKPKVKRPTFCYYSIEVSIEVIQNI